MHISVSRGLDIPLLGSASGKVSKHVNHTALALDVSGFLDLHAKVLVKEGEYVLVGQPLAFDKACPERVFVSPGSGVVQAIVRGEKRRLLQVVVTCEGEKKCVEHERKNVNLSSREEIVKLLLAAGVFPHLRQRPCDVFADPTKVPKAIFINAVRSSPLEPKAELAAAGHETEFQLGINVLKKLTSGEVHLVYSSGSNLQAFTKAEGVQLHTASGPHPVGNVSIHIEKLAPIRAKDEVVWYIDAEDVLRVGALYLRGVYDPRRIVAICGEGVDEEKRRFVETKLGSSFADIAPGIDLAGKRLISGDPLMGILRSGVDTLFFSHKAFCVLPERNETREFLHFFRAGARKYSASKAYLSGFFSRKKMSIDTNLHGEERAFVDGRVYDRVMPLPISTMLLVKAVLSEQYDVAEELGLLEVGPEDFALPTFVCPSKIEMVDIMRNALAVYYEQYVR